MTITIECPGCAKMLRVKEEWAGKRITCHYCRTKSHVPDVEQPTGNSPANGDMTELEATVDDGTGTLILALCLACIFALVTLGCSIYCLNTGYREGVVVGLILLLLALLSGLVAACVVRLFLAQSDAFGRGAKEVPLFYGFVRMILWNPNEGVVFLRNKYIDGWDDNPNDGGGTRFILPFLKQELAIRVDLTVQRTPFESVNVRTLGGLLLTMRGNVQWVISDICKYYSKVNEGTHDRNDKVNEGAHDRNDRVDHDEAANRRQETAKLSLRRTIESSIRTLVPNYPIALFLSNAPTDSVFLGSQALSGPPPQANSLSAFRSELNELIAPTLEQDGLRIREIELQEILLPPELQKVIDDLHEVPARADLTGRARVNEKRYLPEEAELTAKALEPMAKLLGIETVRLMKVLKVMRGMTFFGMPDFLQKLFANLSSNSPGQGN